MGFAPGALGIRAVDAGLTMLAIGAVELKLAARDRAQLDAIAYENGLAAETGDRRQANVTG